MTNVAFIDCETTGLRPHMYEIWELALIVDDVERVWYFEPDMSKVDPNALRISGFYKRAPTAPKFLATTLKWSDPKEAADEIARLVDGRHLVGAVPSFDAGFLDRFLHRNGEAATWHYHLIDVEALAAGYLWRKVAENREAGYDDSREPVLPWDSEALSLAVGVDPADFDRHTALGDARWAKAIYENVVGR